MSLMSAVEYLCSPECLPRTPGRDGGLNARLYLEAQLAAAGLRPAGEDGYSQEIPRIGGANLIARILGNGPLSDRHVLLGAHYDACDPEGWGMPGAGDNAAGVAVALQVARLLQSEPSALDRSVIVCLFDAEEPWYFLTSDMGSQWFVDHPTVDLSTIDLMVCLDLVGHTLGGPGVRAPVRESIFVLGAELGDGTGAVFDVIPPVDGIRPRRIGNHVVPSMSDYDAFLKAGIPFLFYTAGRNVHYHAGTDTIDTLDPDKMAALVEHLVAVVTTFSSRPTGEGRFLPHGSDDAATVRSLRQVLGYLEPLGLETVDVALELLEELADAAVDRELTSGERQQLAMIVFSLEEAMDGS